MQKYSKLIGAMTAMSALVAGNAQAGTASAPAPAVESTPAVSYELHAGYSSQYIFRGVDLGNDLVEAGFDVSTEAYGLGLSAGAWYGSFKAPGKDTGDVTELDLYGEVSKDFGPVTAAAGYIYYLNDNNFFPKLPDAQEAYASLSHDLGFATLSLAYYWDVETDNNGYTALDLSKSYELTSCLTLNVGGTLGYLAEEGHLSFISTKVSLDYAFAEHAKFSPFVAHSWDLSGGQFDNIAASTSSAPGTKNELIGGAMVSVSF